MSVQGRIGLIKLVQIEHTIVIGRGLEMHAERCGAVARRFDVQKLPGLRHPGSVGRRGCGLQVGQPVVRIGFQTAPEPAVLRAERNACFENGRKVAHAGEKTVVRIAVLRRILGDQIGKPERRHRLHGPGRIVVSRQRKEHVADIIEAVAVGRAGRGMHNDARRQRRQLDGFVKIRCAGIGGRIDPVDRAARQTVQPRRLLSRTLRHIQPVVRPVWVLRRITLQPEHTAVGRIIVAVRHDDHPVARRLHAAILLHAGF